MRNCVLLCSLSILLAGCSTTRSDCPPLVDYPPAFQDAAAAELVDAGATSPTWRR